MIAVSKTMPIKVKVTKQNKDSFVGTIIESDAITYDIGYYGTCWDYEHFVLYEETSEIKTPKYYDNSKGSLYKFANDFGLNSWEFDLCKRIIRCRKKGNFKEDLEKTKFLIDLYLKEFNENSL
jgi:hypothetical protein